MPAWDDKRIERTRAKVRREAMKAANRLGARCVMMVAFFEDGEVSHMIDAGQTPIPPVEVYEKLYVQYAGAEENGTVPRQ